MQFNEFVKIIRPFTEDKKDSNHYLAQLMDLCLPEDYDDKIPFYGGYTPYKAGIINGVKPFPKSTAGNMIRDYSGGMLVKKINHLKREQKETIVDLLSKQQVKTDVKVCGKTCSDIMKAFLQAFADGKKQDYNYKQNNNVVVVENSIEDNIERILGYLHDNWKRGNFDLKKEFDINSYWDNKTLKYIYNIWTRFSTKKILAGKANANFYDVYVNVSGTYMDLDVENRSLKCHEEDEEVEYYIEENRVSVHDINVKKLKDVSNHSILSGTGGSGKTMIMRHLLLDSLINYNTIKLFPVYIFLKEYTDNQKSIVDFVIEQIKYYNPDFTREEIIPIIESGNALFLFDGLDEINEESRSRFDNKIEELVFRYPKNMVVISSRPMGSLKRYSLFTEIEISPLTLEKAIELIRKLDYGKQVKNKFINRLEQSLFKDPRFYSFASNPLLLTIMFLVDGEYGQIPTRLCKFYEEAYTVMAKKHDANKDRGGLERQFCTGFDADKLEDYFIDFCYLTYKDQKLEFSDHELSEYFYKICEHKNDDTNVSADSFKEDITINICLLYSEATTLHFIHRSFQEYFCACFFERGNDASLPRLVELVRRRNSEADKTLHMLYEMCPTRVEEFIILPYLKNMQNEINSICSRESFSSIKGESLEDQLYWAFLVHVYGSYQQTSGMPSVIPPIWNELDFMYKFVLFVMRYPFMKTVSRIPDCEYFKEKDYALFAFKNSIKGTSLYTVMPIDKDSDSITEGYEMVGDFYNYKFIEIHNNQNKFRDLYNVINNYSFHIRKEYVAIMEYYKCLIESIKTNLDDLY